MSGLDELIARLEKATGPDRELDNAIAAELGWTFMEAWALSEAYWVDAEGNRSEVPNYSESIDAALTLVPDNLFWIAGKGRVRSNEPLYGMTLLRPVTDEEFARSEHNSHAICICIAALKARAPNLPEGEK